MNFQDVTASVTNLNALMTEPQTIGFVTAIAAAPVTLPPEQWVSSLWHDEQAPFQSPKDFEQYCEYIIQLWNETHQALLTNQWEWPEACSLDKEHIVNTSTSELCEGLLLGWQFTQSIWDAVVNEHEENNALVGGILLCFSMLFDPKTAVVELQQAGAGALEQFEEIFHTLPSMICNLAQRGIELHHAS